MPEQVGGECLTRCCWERRPSSSLLAFALPFIFRSTFVRPNTPPSLAARHTQTDGAPTLPEEGTVWSIWRCESSGANQRLAGCDQRLAGEGSTVKEVTSPHCPLVVVVELRLDASTSCISVPIPKVVYAPRLPQPKTTAPQSGQWPQCPLALVNGDSAGTWISEPPHPIYAPASPPHPKHPNSNPPGTAHACHSHARPAAVCTCCCACVRLHRGPGGSWRAGPRSQARRAKKILLGLDRGVVQYKDWDVSQLGVWALLAQVLRS